MGLWDYYWRVFDLAWAETTGTFGLTMVGFITAAIALALGVLIHWKKKGWPQAHDEVWIFVMYSLAPYALMMLCVMIYNIVISPHTLHMEQQDQTANTQSELSKQKQAEEQMLNRISRMKSEKTDNLARLDHCSELLNERQGQINNQQESIQNCLVELGRAQQKEPLRMKGIWLPRRTQKPNEYERTMILLTNKVVTPVRFIVTCEPREASVSLSIVPMSGQMGGSQRLADGRFSFSIESPAWSPLSNILMLSVSLPSTIDKDPECTLTPQ